MTSQSRTARSSSRSMVANSSLSVKLDCVPVMTGKGNRRLRDRNEKLDRRDNRRMFLTRRPDRQTDRQKTDTHRQTDSARKSEHCQEQSSCTQSLFVQPAASAQPVC